MSSNFNNIYDESLKNPEEFWKKISEDVFWFKKPTKILNKDKDLSVSFIANKSINGQPGFSVEERPSLKSYRISNRDSMYLQLFKKQTLQNNGNIVYSLSVNHFYLLLIYMQLSRYLIQSD